MDRHIITGKNGQIEYFSFGNPNADDFVLIVHAAATGAQAYSKLAMSLANQGSYVLVPNLCGYGATSAISPDQIATLSFHLDILRAVVGSNPFERLHIVGHSMGGLLATLLAGESSPQSLTLIEPMIFSVLDESLDAEAIITDRNIVEEFHGLATNDNVEQGVRTSVEAWNSVEWNHMPEKLRQRLIDLAPQLLIDTEIVTLDQKNQKFTAPDCNVHLVETEFTLLPAKVIIMRLREIMPRADYTLMMGDGHMGPLFNHQPYVELIQAQISANVQS